MKEKTKNIKLAGNRPRKTSGYPVTGHEKHQVSRQPATKNIKNPN
jgi:hypothetical protein